MVFKAAFFLNKLTLVVAVFFKRERLLEIGSHEAAKPFVCNLHPVSHGCNRFFVNPVIFLALQFQFGDHAVGGMRLKCNAPQIVRDLPRDFFFADVRLRTFLSLLGATQVVVAFLRLSRNERAAFAASENASIDVRFKLFGLGFALALHHLLNAIEQLLGDDRLMLAFMIFTAITNDAVIDGIVEDILNIRDGDAAVSGTDEPKVIDNVSQPGKGIVTTCVKFKGFADKGRLDRIGPNRSGLPVVEVAEWSEVWPYASAELLPLSSLDVLGKIVDVIFGIAEHDAQHEFAG